MSTQSGSAGGAAGGELTIVPLETLDLRRRAARLYRAVFGYTGDEDALNPRLLRGLLSNGGSAIGALDSAGRLLGFSYGFTGVAHGDIYHYSQATAVDARAQGMGVGRRLKLAQAEVALATGATSMRWAFDPANARNAHFNFDGLGGRGRWFHRDFYDEPTTDRMIVDWPLNRPQHPADRVLAARDHAVSALAELARDRHPAESGTAFGYVWQRLPATLPEEPSAARRVRDAVAATCEEALAAGLAAVSCRRLDGTGDVVYLFGGDEA